MNYKINTQERQALKGLPYLQRLLYLEALRPYMDYHTGIVGIQRRISYQSLSEELYVEPHPGYPSGSPSKHQIQRALKGLAKSGLIVLQSTEKKLILKCILATSDNYVRNKAAAKPIPEPATPILQKRLEMSPNFQHGAKEADRGENPKAATPPVSGYNILSLAKPGEKISENFRPSRRTVEKAQQQHCPTVFCEDELMKFICYHQSRGTRCWDWEAEFLRWLLRAKHYLQEKKNANRRTAILRESRPRKGSAVEQVIAAYRDDFLSKGPCIEHHE